MVIIRPEAEADIRMARRWYEQTSPGLGVAFVADLDDLFRRLDLYPQLYAQVTSHIRRALTRRFPYAVYYSLRGPKVTVLAVLHQRRNPDKWHSRVAK